MFRLARFLALLPLNPRPFSPTLFHALPYANSAKKMAVRGRHGDMEADVLQFA